jgi:hypothetical protein
MELDGFNEELGIAFEYQGEQHYAGSSHRCFWKRDESWRYDLWKRELCKAKGIKLFVIPFFIKFSELQKFVVDECRRLSLPVRADLDFFDVNSCDYLFANSRVEEIKGIAEKHGGVCLSDKFLGVNEKYRFRCKKGHVWDARFINVKKGYWCPYCAGNGRITFEILKGVGYRKKCELLASGFQPKKNVHKWKCEYGHVFLADYLAIRQNKFPCYVCRREIFIDSRKIRRLFKCFDVWLGVARWTESCVRDINCAKSFWTAEEDDYLKLVYSSAGVTAFMERYPYRSVNSVKNRARIFGLKRVGYHKRWDSNEVEFVKKYYPVAGWKEVQRFLPDRNKDSIKYLAMKYGISFTAHVVWNKGRSGYLNAEARRKMSLAHKDKRCSVATEFKKGLIPWNKGKKMSAESCLKMSIGRKGRVPWDKGLRLTVEHRRNLVLGHQRRKLRLMSLSDKANGRNLQAEKTHSREGRPESTKTLLPQGVFRVPTEGSRLSRTSPPTQGFPASSPMNTVCANEQDSHPAQGFPVGKRVIPDVCFLSHVDGLISKV